MTHPTRGELSAMVEHLRTENASLKAQLADADRRRADLSRLAQNEAGARATAECAPLTREQAIEACARAGLAAEPVEDYDFKATQSIIEGRTGYPHSLEYRAAVLAEARKYPALADMPALARKEQSR